MGNKSTTISMQ